MKSNLKGISSYNFLRRIMLLRYCNLILDKKNTERGEGIIFQ
jgi:hypothetical protein